MSTHSSSATVAAPPADGIDPTEVPVDGGTTERALERNLLFGIAVGTP